MVKLLAAAAVAIVHLLWSGGVPAADVLPPSTERPDARPNEPTRPKVEPPPPPSIDPGIQKTPETIPDPKSAIPPPNVDPEMVIDPEKQRNPEAPAQEPVPTPPRQPPSR
jgi:protein TonB